MEKKSVGKKKQKAEGPKSQKGKVKHSTQKGPALGTKQFQGAGGNLFGYLSQTYGGKQGEEEKTVGGITQLLEDTEIMAEIHGLDDQYKLLFKKIHKKDVATKIKGLSELKACLEEKDKDEVGTISGYFVYVYNKIMTTEYDRKVRELGNAVLGVIIEKARTSLGNYIRKLLPFWFVALSDPSAEVEKLAKANYDKCFPVDRQAKVFELVYESFLNLAHEYLRTSKESIKEDLGSMSDSEKEDVYERVISSLLKAICLCFTMSSAEEELKAKYVDGVIRILNLEEGDSPLFKILTGKHKSGIRAAALEIIVSLLKNVKESVIKKHEAKLSEFVLYSISENNMRIQTVLWSQALITFAKMCENCWTHLNVKKAFLQKLYQCLRKAAFGASPALYDNFIIMLSLFPFIKLNPLELAKETSVTSEVPVEEEKSTLENTVEGVPESKKQKKKPRKSSESTQSNIFTLQEQLQTIKDIMSNMFSAISSEEASIYQDRLVSSYFDCVLFLLWKRILPFITDCGNESEKSLAIETAQSLLTKPIEFFRKLPLSHKCSLQLSQSFTDLFNKMRERNLPDEFIKKIESHVLVYLAPLNDFHINLMHSLCTGVNSSPDFITDLIKLVHEMHKKIRQEIGELISSPTRKKELAINKYHIYCLVTYKFLCMSESPLLKDVYQGHSGDLPELLWLQKLIPNGELELIQYGLLSLSAILNSMGNDFLSYFDQLIDLFGKLPKTSQTEILLQYSINPIQTTLTLEQKLINKAIKSIPQKSELKGLADIMNKSTKWNEIHIGTLKVMLDNSGLLDQYIKFYIHLVSPEVICLLDKKAFCEILKIILNKALLGEIKPQKALEDIIVNYVSKLLLSETNFEKGELLDSIQEFSKKLIQILYNNKASGNSRVWSIVKKLSATGYYSEYARSLACIIYDMLKTSTICGENEISQLIIFTKCFLNTTKTKELSEISILKDLLFKEYEPEIPKNANIFLFDRLSNLRIFNELFLRGGVGASVPQMLLEKSDEKYKYLHISCEMLKSLYLPCSTRTVDTRNQITLYCDVELIPFLVSPLPPIPIEEKASFLRVWIKTLEKLAVEKGGLYSCALEHLLQQLLLAKQEERSCLDPALFEMIFEELVAPFFDAEGHLLTLNQSRNYFSLVVHVISCIEEDLRESKSEKYIGFVKKLQDKLLHLRENPSSKEFTNGLYLLSSTVYDIEFHDKLLLSIMGSIATHKLRQRCWVFKYLDKLFAAAGNKIEALCKKAGIADSKEIMPIIALGIQTCEKEHKIVPEFLLYVCGVISSWINHCSEALNIDILTHRLVEITYQKCQEYKLRMENPEGKINELEYEMFQQLGTQIEKCSQSSSPKIDEELLYSLIGSNIESVQKAGYRLLKQVFLTSPTIFQYPLEEKWDPSSILEEDKEDIKEIAKPKDLNKNIPSSMLEILEKIPSVIDTYQDTLKETKRAATSLETILSSAEEEGKEEDQFVLIPEMYGYLLCWNSLLEKANYCRKNKNEDYLSVLNSISGFLSDNWTFLEIFLVYLTAYLPSSPKSSIVIKEEDLISFDPSKLDLLNTREISKFALSCLFNFMKNYPFLARNFFSQCDPVISKQIASVVVKIISPTIWFAEASNLHNCQDILKENEIEVTMMNTTKEIMASITKDDIEFSISLKFPPNYPLKSIEVTHLTTGIFTEFEIKKWNLSMNKMISSQNCDILGALLLWKANYDKKFEGVEPCPICYSIVHQDTYAIPTLQCKTCKNKFHAACLKRWFRESHKNKCPFCQNYFF